MKTCVPCVHESGYLGGAVAINLRAGSTLFGEALFPVYVGILLWGGLYLREHRLHALIPIARESAPAEEPERGLYATAAQF